MLRNAVVGIYPLATMVPLAEVQAWADYAGSAVIAYDVAPSLPRPELGASVRPTDLGWREVSRHEPAGAAQPRLRAAGASSA